MLDVMYDAPESSDVVHVKITRAVVLGETQPHCAAQAGHGSGLVSTDETNL